MSSDSALDVICLTELLSEHFVHSHDIVLGRDDQGDHAGSVTLAVLKSIDQSLDFPHLDVLVFSRLTRYCFYHLLCFYSI